MDILKAFSLLDTEYQINIQGTLEDPLFQANQIGKLLGIVNIRDTIKDFSENEKGVGLTDTLGGKQETIFLTEYGLYRLLGRSRKPIAHKFQEWMVFVLHLLTFQTPIIIYFNINYILFCATKIQIFISVISRSIII
jgi:hypothetical protein